MSVSEQIDTLIEALRKSNGIEFCTDEQVETLMHLLMDEMMARSTRAPEGDE